MSGGAGDDLIIVDSLSDSVNGGADTDTVESSVDWTLGSNEEHLILTGTAVNGTGNGGANLIIGNSTGNDLSGLSGSDTLYGGAGNDTLDGDGGADQLFGEDGDDILVFGSADTVIDGGAGEDTVQIFSDQDLTGNTSLNDIEIIDMTDGDDVDDLILAAADVLSMTDGDNLLRILGNPDDGDSNATGDEVNLVGGGWTLDGTAGGFDIYTNLNGVTVEIDTDIDVTVS
jgi:hypothetical protein